MSSASAPAGSLAFSVSHLLEGRFFALASFVVVLYSYILTLDSEIQQFWSGKWTISRVLFFCNRYFPLILMLFRIVADFFPDSFPSQFCDFALRINFPLNLTALAVIQGILVIRMWYLYSSSYVAQRFLVACYCACTLGGVVILGLSFPDLHSSLKVIDVPGSHPRYYCADPPPAPLWLVFVPSFVLHGLLSVFMIVRIVRNLRRDTSVPLSRRLTQDGGFLYMVIFFSVSFSISAAIIGVSPSIGVVAMFANFMLALLSISVSHVLLHISTLSRQYSSNPFSKDPILLLHTAKLSRASWQERMGVLVFVPPVNDDDYDEKASALDDAYY